MRNVLRFCLSLTLLAGLPGCGIPGAPEQQPASAPSDQEETLPTAEAQDPPDPEEIASLVETWRELAATESHAWDITSAQMIAQRLSQSEQGLTPLLDVIDDPELAPMTKLFALISLLPFITPNEAPRLSEMTQEDRDTTTRAMATHLLAYTGPREARDRVWELVEDPQHQVKSAAILVLAGLGDLEAIELLPALWQDPQGTRDDKQQILLSAPEEHVQAHQELYKRGVLDQAIEGVARERLLSILGRLGDERVLDVLEEAGRTDPNPSIRTLARGAAEAVRARHDLPPGPEEGELPEIAPAPALEMEVEMEPVPVPGSEGELAPVPELEVELDHYPDPALDPEPAVESVPGTEAPEATP